MAHPDAPSPLARLLPETTSAASRRRLLAALAVSGLAMAQPELNGSLSSVARKKKKGKKKKPKGGKGGSNGGTLPAPTAADLAAFLPLINAHRQAAGKAALTRNSKLDTAAQLHSEDMVARNFFDHDNPDGNGPEARIAAAGYDPGFFGENIFKGSAGAQRAFNAWRDSPDHNTNMLSADFQEIGIGCANANGGQWHWTTVFATPE